MYNNNNSVNLLTSDAKAVTVHKTLLSAHSAVFKEMFSIPQLSEGEPDSQCSVTESSTEVVMMIEGMNGAGRDYTFEEAQILIKLGALRTNFTAL